MDHDSDQLGNRDVVNQVRRAAIEEARASGRPDLADDVALVVTELVTNAILHGGGCTGFAVHAVDHGLRVDVRDGSGVPPVFGLASDEALTGRGVRVVAALSARWGVEASPPGKIVWAEVTGQPRGTDRTMTEADLLEMWGEHWGQHDQERHYHVELGDVPTDLLLAAKAHVDNVAREFALAASGAASGMTADIPAHLVSLLEALERFAEPRQAIKRQALEAARLGAPTARLSLDLPVSAARAASEYLAALDDVDAYSRAARLLTLETPPQHRVFRQWYVGEMVTQLEAIAAGRTPPSPQPFERRLLAELDFLTAAQQASERAARLFAASAALAGAATPSAVADAVLNQGVAALRASGGGLLLASGADRLSVPGAVGYDDVVLAGLRSESRDAELPAAVALRTGKAVWLESRDERDLRFPDLVGLEAGTIAMCAVPLMVQGRVLGALRFSFNEARLFDDEEQQFVLALASQTAQALDRTQLQEARIDVSRRLQRSLLPPQLPSIPGIEVAAIYHPFGDGVDVGGDFYDMWQVSATRWATALGDASGTGPEAAALSALVRHTLRALTLADTDVVTVMRNLNLALSEATAAAGDRFCTALFGTISVDGVGNHEGEVELALAGGGHPPVFVSRVGGGVEVLVVGGSLLGVFPDPEIGHLRLTLHPGDTALLLTDGVLEARRAGVQFDIGGVERVLTSTTGAAQTLAALERAVLDHVGGVLTDDVAALAFHVVSR